MSVAREIIHDLVNSLSIGHGMAKILDAGIKNEREMTEEQKLEKMKKVLSSFEKMTEQLEQLRALAKEKDW